MRTFAQALDLRDDPEMIEEYERWHRAVWPEVVTALRGVGVSSMRIFRIGTRLFMVFEAPDDFDPARDFQKYAANEKCREWDELMRKYQRRVPGASGDGWWSPMKEVFSLEWCGTGRESGSVRE